MASKTTISQPTIDPSGISTFDQENGASESSKSGDLIGSRIIKVNTDNIAKKSICCFSTTKNAYKNN